MRLSSAQNLVPYVLCTGTYLPLRTKYCSDLANALAVANDRSTPTPKRNLKPSPTSASSGQPNLAPILSPIQIMSQPMETTSPFATPHNPKKRRLSGQVTPSPILPAPAAQASSSLAGGTESAAGPTTDPPVTAPTPKKGRTNTPWTPAEELRLKKSRDEGKSWSEIAKVRHH